MPILSLDPRVTRLEIPEDNTGMEPIQPHEYFETYEVFHQAKSGDRHVHVGSVHAPSPELAFVFAKEQYGRRSKSYNMWVVRSADVMSINPEDSDMFETAPEKTYREAGGYKVRDKINAYKKQHGSTQQSA